VSAMLSGASQQGSAPVSGPPPLLLSLAAAAVFPFDQVLAGMVAAGQGIQALCLFLGLTRSALDEHLVRLGLATPHDRPLRQSGRHAWSVLDTVRLIAWRIAGVHPEVIGLRLGRSANAVRAKARRLGIQAPGRKALHKPHPATLTDPMPGFGFGRPGGPSCQASPVAACGPAAGPLSVLGAADAAAVIACPISPPVGDPHPAPEPAAQPVAERAPQQVPSFAPSRPRRRWSRPEGQRELSLFGVAGGADTARHGQQSEAVVAPAPAIPGTEADVDLNGNLTWIGTVHRPLTNRVVVWVCGMLMLGGLHWKQAALRVGMTPDVFRTVRTRCAIPVDYNRQKLTSVFNEAIAHATCERSGYVVKQCIKTGNNGGGSGKWFWVHKDDRNTRVSPTERRRDHQIEGRSNTVSIVTHQELAALAGKLRAPFAERPAMMRAG
jgi:hypothetical protein